MTTEKTEPTNAQILAGIIKGTAQYSTVSASIQRSHRFPLHIFSQIENLASISNTSVSLIINELLECGLEAVKQELPSDLVARVSRITQAQIDRTNTNVSGSTKGRPKKVTSIK